MITTRAPTRCANGWPNFERYHAGVLESIVDEARPDPELPTGVRLIERWDLSTEHRHRSETCPSCGAYLSSVELTDVAYAFRLCECSEVDYVHLVEQLWHLACLQARQPDVDSAAAALLDALASHWHVSDAMVRLRMALKERSS